MSYERAFLCQADSGKALGSTFIERKQMSTKTTLKRIALVAVSALGFGIVSAIPSSAAVTSFSLRHSSMTVVDSSGTGFATFVVRASNGVAGNTSADSLTASETINVTTISTPNQVDSSTKASALTFSLVTSDGSTDASDTTLPMDSASAVESDDPFTSTATDGYGVYYVKVLIPADAANAGSYSIRFELSDGTDILQRTTATVKMVRSVSDLTDATLSISTAPTSIEATTALGQTAQTVTSVTVTNGASGLVVSSGLTTQAPTVALRTTADCDTPETLSDAGGGSAAAYTDVTKWDGNFTIKFNAVAAGCVGTTTALRAIFLGSGVSSTDSIAVTAAASKYGFTVVSSTGSAKQSSSDSAYVANYFTPLTTKSATVTLYVVATDSVDGDAVTGHTVYYTVGYAGAGCVTADLSPTADTLTKGTTDADGAVSVTVTNANPVDECTATVTFSGVTAVTTSGDLSRDIKWDAPRAVSVTSSPSGNYQALLKSSNTVTFTITDQYSKPVAGKTVVLTLSGSNAPTAGVPSKTSDANGVVSHTWTDALAVADGTDTIAVSTVGGDSPSTTGTRTITYKSALSTVAKFYSTWDTTTAMSTEVIVPSTNIGGATGRLVSDADQIDLTSTVSPSAAAAHLVALRFKARTSADVDVTGVPTTVTIDNGYILDGAGKAVKSRLVYANDAFYVIGTKTGVSTVTATNGSVTSKATINWINATGDARVLTATEKDGTVTATVTDFAGNTVKSVGLDVSVTGAKLGTGASFGTYTTNANGTVSFDITGAGTVEVKLTSAAKSVNLLDSGDSTGAVSTPGSPAGVRTVTLTTNGTVDAAKVAADAATAAANAATAAAKAAEAAAVAAAEKAAKDAVAAAKAAQDAAVAESQAATDAAAEAIDAANAATDAANLAAEAADAATVAAEEARDAADAATAAVEELATQVATLMAALKAQITTLANTVAKIAKKVKA
jgi:hypothetical protein